MSPSHARIRALLFAGLVAAGCTSDEWPPLVPLEEPDDEEAADDGAYDDARLQVLEPESGTIFEVGEPVHLEAVVRELDGPELSADDVAWVVDDGEFLLDTLEGDVELSPGIHDLRAIARLPNGDRLETTVSDVRVQSRWTGVYDGQLDLDIEVSIPGIPVAPRCVGPLDMQVSVDGRTVVVEDGACSIDVFGQSFEGTYSIDVVVFDAGLVRGTVDISFDSPVGLLETPIEWAGAFYDDRFSAGLREETELPGVGSVLLRGSLQAERTDDFVDPDLGE